MARSRYLVCYDISDDLRLRTVHAWVKGYGHSLQYSVFVCDLSEVELINLRVGLHERIHHRQDRIAIIDLGDPQRRGRWCFEFLGQFPELPEQGATVL